MLVVVSFLCLFYRVVVFCTAYMWVLNMNTRVFKYSRSPGLKSCRVMFIVLFFVHGFSVFLPITCILSNFGFYLNSDDSLNPHEYEPIIGFSNIL